MTRKILGRYEILSPLGAGGMGEVYRARDIELGREVAIKILPPEFSRDPERIARFRREAKVLASLNHPNVAVLFGFEQEGDTAFLAMELVEGEPLSERLQRGPIPLEEALPLAAAIAAGLEEAHDKGIVHRDLKPANVVLGEGRVKVLDFGLATAMAGDVEEGGDITDSPTITQAFTQQGTILGTAAYMSPEQARGKPVDRRTDIWSFGVLLHEMLTGSQPFAGETISDTLAAVLTREVDPAALPAGVPVAVRHVLARCLERDPRRRLRDIGEARLLLEDPQSTGASLAPAGNSASRSPSRTVRFLPWVLLLVALGAGGPLLLSGGGDEPPPTIRFEVQVPLTRLYNSRGVEISPDGRTMAIFSTDGLFARPLDQAEPRLLVGPDELTYDETGVTPFWSPDSRMIAYGAQGRLWKIPAAGGEPSVICTLPGGWGGGAWADDGTIVFSTARGPMYQVPARGGDPTVRLANRDNLELDYHTPSWVADGGGFVYSVHRPDGVDTIELLRGDERTVLLRIEGGTANSPQVLNNPVYSSTGHILYQRDQGNRGLWALPFDARAGEATGDPFLLQAEQGHPSVSRDGTLVYTRLSVGTSGELIASSRSGQLAEVLTGEVVGLRSPALSPDGSRLAYSGRADRSNDIFLLDRRSGLTSRLTLGSGDEDGPHWFPGGERLAYSAPDGEDCPGIWAVDADGTGQPELLLRASQQPTLGANGADLVAATMCRRERGLLHHRVGSGEEPVVLREHPKGIDQPRLSPDGRFLAYRSWESGEPTLEVASFPSMTGRRPIARSESMVRWSADGSELYYVAGNPPVMTAARIADGPAFNIVSQEELFTLSGEGVQGWADFDVNADGSEFILIRSQEGMRQLESFQVVTNWYEAFGG